MLELDKFLPRLARARSRSPRAAATRPRSGARANLGRGDVAELVAERAFLAELEGSCRTPIAGLARFEAGRLRFRGEVLRADGSERFDIAVEGASADAGRLGRDAGRELKARLPEGVLAESG